MKKLTIIILSFSIIFPLFAERIVLKTGKEINKKITERTEESITVEVLGMPVTYKLSDITSIDDEIFAPVEKKVPVAKESSDIAPQLAGLEWYQSIQGYVEKVNSISQKIDKVIREGVNNLTRAMQADDFAMATEAFEKIIRNLSGSIEKLKLLSPPSELKKFHRKIIESQTHYKEAFEGMFNGNKDLFLRRRISAVEKGMEANEELKRVYKTHNMPHESISEIDAAILMFRQRLSELRGY